MSGSSLALNQLVGGFSLATAQFQSGMPAAAILEGVRNALPDASSELAQATEPLLRLSVANGEDFDPRTIARAFHESAMRLEALTSPQNPEIVPWAKWVRETWQRGISYPPELEKSLVAGLGKSDQTLIEWLRQFIEFSPQPMGVVRCHSSGDVEMVLFNRKNRERWGLGERDVDGVSALRFFYPEDHDLVRAFIRECLETGSSERRGVRMLRSSGGHLIVDMYVGRVDATNYAYFQVIDETQREEALAQVRIRDAVFRNAGKPFLMLSFDEEGVPSGMVTSLGFDQMMGYGPGEMGVKPVLDFIPKRLRPEFANRVADFLETGALNWPAVELVRKDGSTVLVDIEANGSGVKGQQFGIVSFTDAKARIAAERDSAEAQKLHIVSQVSAAIAHDANNLITIISGGLQMLRENTRENTDDEELYRDMMQNIDMLTAMLNGFRQMTDTVREELVINSLLKESMIRLVVPKITGVKIELDLDDDLWPVSGPNFTVWQIAFNIIKNAMEAMANSAEKKLTITTENASLLNENSLRRIDPSNRYPNARPGDYVMLSVRDTGSGISSENLERLFEDYFSTKWDTQVSRGRGLHASQQTISKRGGLLRVQSHVGHGTTFEIYLPRAGQTPPPPMTVASMLDSRWMSPGREVILVADDDETLRGQYQKILGHYGYAEVLVARTTDEVLDIARSRSDLTAIMMDWRMPGITGDELLGELAQINPNLPILVNTGLVPGHADRYRQVQFTTKLRGALSVGPALRRLIQGERVAQ